MTSSTTGHQQQQQHHAKQHGQIGTKSYKIITQYGDMLVVKQGVQHHHQSPSRNNNQQSQQQQQQQPQQTRPIIMTFHDLGLNSELQFAKFCDCDEVKLMLQTFTMIHVNFVGQEMMGRQAAGGQAESQAQAAHRLPADFKYPSCEQMAECIVDVCTQLRVRSFIALAVGAGAHIVCSLALMRPDLVDGLFLINPVASSCTITEWLYFKMSAIASNHQVSGGDQHVRSSSSSPTSRRHRRDHSPSADQSSSGGGGGGGGGGFRKLLNAAQLHLHLPHHNQPASNHHHGNAQQLPADHPDSASADAQSVGQASTCSAHRQPASSRLRRLIVSRNFRLGGHQEGEQQHQESTATPPPQLERKGSRGSAHSNASSAGGARGSASRPPLEYLMYHHFGPSSFQRYRRSSASSTDSPTRADTERAKERKSADELDSLAGSSCSRSHDSLAATPTSQPRARSSSLCLDAVHLAALPSGRQRLAYVRSAYKHYFGQLDEHNLWLFAQSFVKRRALNLRKDCGAAAHAAAAAAALGTSICSAFVGLAPAHPQLGSSQQPAAAAAELATAKRNSGDLQTAAQLQAASVQQQASGKQRQQQALVAGTKVKRTFTCQTLIMCSSVQIHCERAFKLMSLLNPLQATWIKTDHLLVLEERPEKVCQALRLFLQGIGYSMSTYERRLRLSHSAHGSASSADSNDSMRSLATNTKTDNNGPADA